MSKDNERLKTSLEKTITAKFSNVTDEQYGVLNGVLPSLMKQIKTGQFSDNPAHQNNGATYEDFQLREQMRDEAYLQVNGFIWGFEAAGAIAGEECESLRKELLDIRADEARDPYLEILKKAPARGSVDLETGKLQERN